MNNIFLHTLFLAMIAILALLFPSGWQTENTIRFTLTRVVAGGVVWRGFQLVAFVVPYRPNRTYYRLSVVRV